MNPILLVAENKIREAIENGEFDNLPGQGKPIDLLKDQHLPAEFRMAQKILQNAGYADQEDGYYKVLSELKDENRKLDQNSKEALVARLTGFREAQIQARKNRR